VNINVEEGLITYSSDGTYLRKDLLVIVDGVKVCTNKARTARTTLVFHSQTNFVSNITGKEEQLVPLGRSVFRYLIPFEKVMQDAELRIHFEDEGHGRWVLCNPLSWTYVGILTVTKFGIL